MRENDIAKEIVDASIRIHVALGPGLLESVYESVLAYEVTQEISRSSDNNRFRWSMKAFASIPGFEPT